jgi:hypothetical protein
VDSEHAHLIYRYEAGKGVTVVDKNEGSYGVITPDLQRALDEKKRRDGDDGGGSMSFIRRVNPEIRARTT